jgi:hypothetical protein
MSIFFRSKSFTRKSASALIAVGVLVGVAVGGGVGVIAATSTKTVTVCANKKTNMLRYAKNGKCAKTETRVVLNQSGLAGERGEPGIAGTNGTNGTNGINGVNATNTSQGITQRSVCDGTDVDTIANEVCKVGMTGPGGGLIFYVDYNDQYATYDYLEAAPTDGVFAGSNQKGPWATNAPFCDDTAPQTTDCQTATLYTELYSARTAVKGLHRGLFGGKLATAAIVARHDAGSVAKNLYAAGVADDYSANGLSDWWLPSYFELEMMLANLVGQGLGFFSFDWYLSSTELGSDSVMARGADYGDFRNVGKNSDGSVRPVRAF